MRRRTRSRRQAQTPQTPRKPLTLAEQMKVALMLRNDQILWVMHEKPFKSPPEWVEYDGDDNILIFVGKDGATVNLGLPIPPEYGEVLLEAEHVMIAHVENETVHNYRLISMVTRKTGEDEEDEE